MHRTGLPLLALLLAVLAAPAGAQAVDVTFRFLPDLSTPEIEPVVRAFVPGAFNDWGPNNAGRIATGAPSQATSVAAENEYRYATTLAVGRSYAYKMHVHRDPLGSDWAWFSDPLGTETTGPNNDSVVRVTDPMVFQVAREQDGTDQVRAVSAGVFGTADVASVRFTVDEAVYPASMTEHTGDGVYRLRLPSPVAPGAYVRVDAVMEGGATASAEVGVLPRDVTDAPVPDGLEDGITYDPADPTRAWLVLRAPRKRFVYALGDFNGWTADDDALMFRDTTDPLGTRWWTEVTGLTPGTEVAFQYWVDGQIRVADPYATQVVHPGEPGYPDGAVDHAVGLLTSGAPAFAWTDQGFEPPPLGELVVYELLVRDFTRDRSFTALTDSLDYLHRLGVNAVQLMPVAEADSDDGWGYDIGFHFALDKRYGTADEFKAFVDAAHARGIAVLLDVVYNHATGRSPLVRLYNSGGLSDATADNPYANAIAPHGAVSFYNDLDHESPLTRLWLDRANRFWMDEYHVDGYRFDVAKGFTQRQTTGFDAWAAYDAGRVATIQRMADRLWEAHPDALVVLEQFAELREELELATHGTERGLPGMALWNNLSHPYAQAAMGYLGADSDLTVSLPSQYGYPAWGRMPYMESHDEQWQLYKTRTFGNRSGDYDTRGLATALDRKKLATVFFLTLPGPRHLWQFGELGYGGGPAECLKPDGGGNGDCAPSDPERIGNKPIRWDYWADVPPEANGTGRALTAAGAEERDRRRRVYAVTAAVLGLRADHALFRSADTEVTASVGGTAGRWVRLSLPDVPDGQAGRAVIVGNFGLVETTVTPGFAAGTWYDFFNDGELEASGPGQSVTLRPGEYRVYTDVDVPSPPGDLGAVSDEGGPDAGTFGLDAFPNPSAGPATVRVSLASPGPARVEALDLLGRRVAVLHDGALGGGPHDVAADFSGLPAGVYLVRLVTEAGVATERVTVAR